MPDTLCLQRSVNDRHSSEREVSTNKDNIPCHKMAANRRMTPPSNLSPLQLKRKPKFTENNIIPHSCDPLAFGFGETQKTAFCCTQALCHKSRRLALCVFRSRPPTLNLKKLTIGPNLAKCRTAKNGIKVLSAVLKGEPFTQNQAALSWWNNLQTRPERRKF